MSRLRSVAVLFFISLSSASAQEPAKLTFEEHIRPIFKAYCFECHGEGPKLRGGLDLRLRRLLVEGGNSGPAIVPSKRAASMLYDRIVKQEMPPGKKKLGKDEIERIGRWLEAGAPTGGPEPETIATGFHITPQDRSFWSFQPIRRPLAPAVRHQQLVRNSIDVFLLHSLEAKGLSFSPEADRHTLIRRVSFDLLGLPPTPEEVEQFVADGSPDAYERLIDRLLASPHYGERWGRHWLDVVGYADSDGYTPEDTVRRFAYLYRDYVIRAFHADLPFDRFIQEQLAGDELVRPPYDQLRGADLDKLVATGFLRMAPDGTASRDVDQPLARNQVVADTVQIVATSLMGVTVHCAQCHNHRYDPIPQSDYYAMRAIFEPALNWKSWRLPVARNVTIFDDADRKKADELEAEAKRLEQAGRKYEQEQLDRYFQDALAKVPEALRDEVWQARNTKPDQRSPRQLQLLRDYPAVAANARLRNLNPTANLEVLKYLDEAAQLRAAKPMPLPIPALTEVPGTVPQTFLFQRGDHQDPKEAVPPGGLTILAPLGLPGIPEKDPALPTTGRRLTFAKQLTSGVHPLTARVLVNRFWLHHFGRGIVNTPGDLGFLGERPSHPELLDWLASEFMANGWRLKPLHKLMMTSTAYRQQSRRTPELERTDPDNVLLGRMSTRRLEAEILRDAVLAVNGKLNRNSFGPPVPCMPDVNGQIVLGVDNRDDVGRPRGNVVPLNGEEFRRSVYVQVRRSMPLTLLSTFDAPRMEPCCDRRSLSTVTPQALLLMNSDFIAESARAFAGRLLQESPDLRQQLERGWRLAFADAPTAAQISEAVEFITAQTEVFRGQKRTDAAEMALANYCQALLSTNRFLYVD
jgi:mono/diheme cytochrome c family protein